MYCTVSKTHRALFHLKGRECGTFRLTDRPEEGTIVGEWEVVLPDDGAVNLTLLASVIQAKLDKSWENGEVFDLLGVWRSDGKVGYYLRSYGEDAWETSPALFCERGGYVEGSRMAKAISDLSPGRFAELVAFCDPAEDNLIHVDGEGYTVNHGNVGRGGIKYYWSV